jgi:selenocysteine lyase/cysteine desulfurase
MEREGMEVTWLEEKNGRIELDDVEQAVRSGTKLIVLSLVSTRNGFQHDLKAVCDIAHAKGAYVYADIVHGAGCIPIDVKESGVDFAATASYKWLMGDFGLGFLYVRKDVLPKIKRTNYGYFGLNTGRTDDARADAAANGGYPISASGYFALGTRSFTTVAILEKSLQYIHGIGVNNIQNHAQILTNRLKEELPRLGYPLMTPLTSKTPIVSCKFDNARGILGQHIDKAKVKFSTYNDHFRISASVFNDMDDVERLLEAVNLKK